MVASRLLLVLALVTMAPIVSPLGVVHGGSPKPDLVLSYYLLQQVGLNEFGTVPAAVPPANGTLTGVGLQVVYDYPVTTRPPGDSGAARVGSVRGTSTVVTNSPASTVFAVSNVVHYDGTGAGAGGLRGTLAQQGEAAFSSGSPWEYAIVGGTGDFRRARGYNIGRVVSISRLSSSPPVIVTGYNASIWF